VKYTLSFRKEARADIRAIHEWYERESEGLGEEFLEDVDIIIEYLKEFPTMYARVSPRIRRAFTKRFPYSLFYYFIDNEIIVVGCRHMHQNPASWPVA
jgi:plasmid stabilization system protein ParE